MSTQPTSITTDDHATEEERRSSDASESGSFAVERARRAVTQGGKAAGLTAAGLAAGVLLESQTKLSSKLPLSRRTTRTRAMRHAIAKRLP